VWVLTGNAVAKRITKVVVTTGAVQVTESVSRMATSIAQSANGQLILGTANGTSSAVVFYNGSTGAFSEAVRMAAPVLYLAISYAGDVKYAIEQFRHHRTLRAFDGSASGFSFPVAADAVGIAPVAMDADAWILGSGGSLDKLRFFPNAVTRHTAVTAGLRALAVCPAGDAFYVLVTKPSTGATQIEAFSKAGHLTSVKAAPLGSASMGISADGRSLYVAVNTGRSGRVVAIPAAG
jgi:hypothetical protein